MSVHQHGTTFSIDVQDFRRQSFVQMTDVIHDLIQFSYTMILSMFVKYMLQLRQGVKNTPAHVHELYSCLYNMLVYFEYMSWYDTFGLHTGPLS